ncbi:MAG: C40 family peptidase [Bacteroidota bacterium]
MSFVICMVPVAPLRKEDAHRSEMVSQILFGELAEVLEERKLFTRIRCLYDGYEGWCQTSQLIAIGPALVDSNSTRICSDWENLVELNGQPMHLSMGTALGLFHDNTARINEYTLAYLGNAWDVSQSVFEDASIRKMAMQYLNTPYLWGGRSVFGIDCSGFVQQVFRFFGKKLPRDAYQQAGEGEVVGFLQEVKCGDLAFFDNEEGKITHVGLLFSPDMIIHSSGKVRIDKIDNMGIINSDTGERTHTLRIIKRFA